MWYVYKWNIAQPWKWSNAFCSNMDRSRDYHTDWSDRDRQISYDYLYVKFQNKKGSKWTYLPHSNRVTEAENKHGAKGWAGDNWKTGADTRTPLNRQIPSLLCSTGSSTQYSNSLCGKRRSERVSRYTSITGSLCCRLETLWINDTLIKIISKK